MSSIITEDSPETILERVELLMKKSGPIYGDRFLI